MLSVCPTSLSILLVDDNCADRLLAEEAFDLLPEPVNVQFCSTGPEALAWLRCPEHPRPDVMLLDVNMPGMSGLEVLETLRADPGLRSLVVVMLTTSSQPQDQQRASELAASAYWVKETDFANFTQQVEAFVRTWQHVPSHQLAPDPPPG
ncbi:response regulator (plasmid) [Deinococcus taeanensis]|uniref:response regulator n=1 Tax=Deinococcus taeanensis TaxID=2737050 RepID=UPI001CDD60E1|nr:response regulator [Deinococcus taeanensis]UBV45393.1 response regulator [Deinococcus taeanensis]